MPWAEKIEESAVDKVQAYETVLGEAGFRILDVEDKNKFAIIFFETMIARMKESEPRPLGLHLLMGDNTKDQSNGCV